MISINKQFTLSGSHAPYTFSFSAPDNCVTFEPHTGTTSSIIDVKINFEDIDCFENQPLELTAVNSEGCESTLSFSVDSPCTSFNTTFINQIGDYTFTISGSSPGCSSLSFNWAFNSLFFDAEVVSNNFSSTITLTPKTANIQSFPTSSTVSINVSNCSGCINSSSLTFPICKLNPQTVNTGLFCVEFSNGTILYSTPSILFPEPEGCDSTANWPTVSFNLPSGWQANRTSLNWNQWAFWAPSSTPTGVYTGTYTVRDSLGFMSNVGTINFTVVPCNPKLQVAIPNQVYQIDCTTQSDGDVITLNVENLVLASPGSVIDWSTWQILSEPSYLSPSITLSTNISGQHVINYTIPDPPANDVFAWTVCDTEGNCAEASFYTITGCTDAPVAVADSGCAVCGTPITINVLNNDTSDHPLVQSSVSIVTYPTKGWVNILPNGDIQYTPEITSEGEDTFTYTVKNVFGQTSNAATVTVNIICAGGSATINLCNI